MYKSTHKILLIDDSKSNILILKELLSEFGFETYEVYSGIEAIEVLLENQFDLILLDIIMPEIDGFETCRRIKQYEKLKNIPVIFLTALTDLNSIEKGFEHGAVDYITKPFKQKEILARIRTHLELNAYRSNLEQLVYTKTEQLEKTNLTLINEINQKNIIQLELEDHKNKLEEIVKQRTIELSESEERFRTIFEKNGSNMILVNPENGKIFNVNDTASSFYGYNKEEFTEKTIFDINPMPKKNLIEELAKAKSKERNYFQLKHKLKNGEIKDVEVYSLPISINNMTLLISTIHDITEKKQIQNKILNAIIETEEKEKQRFAKDLHDGLGPILSTAKLYLKSLEQNCNNLCQKNNPAIISKIDEIINEAIVTAKDISNHLSPHILSNFGFVTGIKSISKKIENSSKLKFNISYNNENRFEHRVETSAYRIVLELINNTIKHAKATLIDIKILIYQDKILISYTDNGIGFDTLTINNENSGMGLTNIKNRIESLNGELEIISKQEKGINVKFFIPLDTENML